MTTFKKNVLTFDPTPVVKGVCKAEYVLTQDTNGKVTNSQLDTTNESQEVSPFPAGDHKAHINRRAKRHS